MTVRDVTGSKGCFGLWGPRARDILSSVSAADLSNEAFPYMTAREIVVGDVPCLALRVTYVGELGWELYPSVEYAGALWDTLIAAGEPHGMVPAGYRAIDSLRLEKGYRAWSSDITPEEHPFEAGLGFAVRMDVPGFIGNEALERALAAGITKRLCCLTLADERAMTLGNEPVFHDGTVVSRVTSGGIGYAVGASIAYAYLPVELAVPAPRARSRCSASASPRPSRTSRSGIRRASGSRPEDLAGLAIRGRLPRSRKIDVLAREDGAVPVGLEALRLVADALHVEMQLVGRLHPRERVVDPDTIALFEP